MALAWTYEGLLYLKECYEHKFQMLSIGKRFGVPPQNLYGVIKTYFDKDEKNCLTFKQKDKLKHGVMYDPYHKRIVDLTLWPNGKPREMSQEDAKAYRALMRAESPLNGKCNLSLQVDEATLEGLAATAKARGIDPNDLAAQLIDTSIKQDLVRAILDL